MIPMGSAGQPCVAFERCEGKFGYPEKKLCRAGGLHGRADHTVCGPHWHRQRVTCLALHGHWSKSTNLMLFAVADDVMAPLERAAIHCAYQRRTKPRSGRPSAERRGAAAAQLNGPRDQGCESMGQKRHPREGDDHTESDGDDHTENDG